MKKVICFLLIISLLLINAGCTSTKQNEQVVATTKPVYDFTSALCDGTGIQVSLLVTESLSCLHDYTLQVRQMRMLEGAQTVIISGAGLEDFLHDALEGSRSVIDASQNIPLHCNSHHEHEAHDGHNHENDPHIWLNIDYARTMAKNIHAGLSAQFPRHKAKFDANLKQLNTRFDALAAYGTEKLSSLKTKDLITFHDGFGYFAEYWNLTILRAVEEESGSEASAAELKELICLVRQHNIPAIFIEENGSTSAPGIIASETGVKIFSLNMGMSNKDYFSSMVQNIDSIKEALG